MIRDFKYYAAKITAELKVKDPIKYRYLTEASVANHIRHIGYCLKKIILTRQDSFKSDYFELRRSYRSYTKYAFMNKKNAILKMEELSKNVNHDNVIDRLCIKIINNDFDTVVKTPEIA